MTAGERRLIAAPGILALAGVAVSVYLTAVHYSGAQLACNMAGPVNCQQVVSSAYGSIMGSGVPTSAAGAVWFLVSGLFAVAQWVMPDSTSWAAAALGWAAIGLAVVLYLVGVEIIRLGAICEWCTAVHVLVLGTFLCNLVRFQTLLGRVGATDRPGA